MCVCVCVCVCVTHTHTLHITFRKLSNISKTNTTIYDSNYLLHLIKSNLQNKNLNLNKNRVIVEHLKHQINENKKSLAKTNKTC